MKTLLFLLLMTGAAFGQTTYTNAVKISSLPSASTPLSGSEVLALNQSGTTKQATVNQLIAAAVTANNSTSNSLAALLAANSAADVTASNSLQAQVTANKATANSASNTVAGMVTTETSARQAADTSLSNSLALKYDASNPSGYQTASQVQSIADASAAAAAQGIIASNGSALFNTVTATNFYYRVKSAGTVPNSTVWLDLSAGSLQTLSVTNKGTTDFYVTNQAPGQSVTFVLRNSDSTGRTFRTPATFQPVAMMTSGGSSVTVGSGKVCALAFTVTSTNQADVLYSVSIQQN